MPSRAPHARLSPTEDQQLWTRLLDSTPGATSFHDWDLLDLMERVQGVRVERLLVHAGDEPVGVFPVPRRSARSLKSAGMPFPYLGPVVRAEHLAAALRAFRRWQRSSGLLLGQFEFAPAAVAAAAPALRAAGLPGDADSTVILDLSHGSQDELWRNVARSRQQKIRKAEKIGISVRPCAPGEMAELLPRIMAEAYEAHGKPSPYADGIGAELEEWARDRTDLYAATAVLDGEPTGLIVMLANRSVAYGWVGGGFRRFRDQNPGSILYYDSMRWAIEHGHTALDFVGRVDPGVLHYKRSFGGVETPYLTSESFIGPAVLRNGAARLKAVRAAFRR